MTTTWKRAALGLLATLILILTSVIGVVITTTSTAAAAGRSTGLGGYDISYAVATTGDGTMYGVCAEHGKATPTTVSGDWSDPAAYWTGDAGTLSWLGSEFGKPGTPTWRDPSGTVLSKGELDGGIAWVAAHRFQVPGTNGGTTGATQGASYGHIVTSFITANPGPWTITKVGPTPGSPYSSAGAGFSGTFYVESATHHPVPGVPLAVSGVALEATSEWGASTGAGGTHSWTSTAPAAGTSKTVTVSVSGGGPSTHGAVLYAPTGSNAQALLAFTPTGAVSLSFSVSTAKPVTPPHKQPGTLTIVKKDASGGSNLGGAVFHVTGPSYPYGVTVGIPATGSKTLAKLTSGSYTISEISPPPGWSLTTTPQTVTVGSTGTAPVVSPTVTFSDSPPTPTMTTADPTAFAKPDAVLADSFTISGLPTNAAINGGAPDAGPVAWGLDGPVARGPTGSCSTATFGHAPRFESGTTPIAGNGTYTAGPANAVTVAGCYGWAETLPASAYNSAVSSGPNATGEQTTVVPTLTTKAGQSGSSVGATLTDTASVTGLTPTYAGTLTWTLLGPLPPYDGACTTTGTGGPAWEMATVAQNGHVSAPKNGPNLVTTGVVPAAGCYSFSEGLTADKTVPAVSPTAPGISTETVYVAPSVTTKASRSSAGIGGTLSDTATVTGITGLASSVAYTLYGPVPPTNALTCPTTAQGWKTAPTFAVGTLAVTKDGTYTLTATRKVSVAGCYDWTETLASTATPPGYLPVSTTLGTSAESTYQAPVITTKANSSEPTVGATLTDTATVTGITGLASSVAYTLYGPVPPTNALTCPTTVVAWKTAPTFAAGTLAVTKDGTYTLTATPKVSVAGCYDWTETLASTGTPRAYTQVSTTLGTSAESTYETPVITTKASASLAAGGATLTDGFTVGGITSPATVTATLYGPVPASSGPSCKTAKWDTAPVTGTTTTSITAPGTFTTAPIKVTSAGCYTWTDELTSTNSPQGFVSVTTPRGTATETTVVLVPTAKTIALSHTARGGALVADEVTVSGLRGAAATLTGALYGPLQIGHGLTCKERTWKNAPIVAKTHLEMTGSGTKTTTPITLTQPGCYSFAQEVRVGSTVLDTVPAGQSTETLAVLPGGHGTGTKSATPGTAGKSEVPGANLIVTGGGVPPNRRPFPLQAVLVFIASGLLMALGLVLRRRRAL